MNAAQRRHYAAIQQLARDEWPTDDLATCQQLGPTYGDCVFNQLGTFHTLADGTIIMDEVQR